MHGEVALPVGRLKKIALQAVPDRNFKPRDSEEYHNYNRLRWQYENKYSFSSNTLLWTNEEEHLKICKPYPEVVELN